MVGSRRPLAPEKRRREGRSMKLLASVKEAVADAQVEILQDEKAEARPGPPGPRADEDGGAEQPDFRQRSADLRPRHSRVRRLVLLRASPRVQPHRGAP